MEFNSGRRNSPLYNPPSGRVFANDGIAPSGTPGARVGGGGTSAISTTLSPHGYTPSGGYQSGGGGLSTGIRGAVRPPWATEDEGDEVGHSHMTPPSAIPRNTHGTAPGQQQQQQYGQQYRHGQHAYGSAHNMSGGGHVGPSSSSTPPWATAASNLPGGLHDSFEFAPAAAGMQQPHSVGSSTAATGQQHDVGYGGPTSATRLPGGVLGGGVSGQQGGKGQISVPRPGRAPGAAAGLSAKGSGGPSPSQLKSSPSPAHGQGGARSVSVPRGVGARRTSPVGHTSVTPSSGTPPGASGAAGGMAAGRVLGRINSAGAPPAGSTPAGSTTTAAPARVRRPAPIPAAAPRPSPRASSLSDRTPWQSDAPPAYESPHSPPLDSNWEDTPVAGAGYVDDEPVGTAWWEAESRAQEAPLKGAASGAHHPSSTDDGGAASGRKVSAGRIPSTSAAKSHTPRTEEDDKGAWGDGDSWAAESNAGWGPPPPVAPRARAPSPGRARGSTGGGGASSVAAAAVGGEVYRGHGLSFSAAADAADPANRARATAASATEVAAANREAAALRAEVAELRQLMGIWKAGGDVSAALPTQQAPAALQRTRAQVYQLQRQVALMGLELKAQARVVREAEGALSEVASRLEGMLGDASTGSGPDIAAAASLQRWAADTLQRLKGERRQSARTLTRSGITTQQEQVSALGAAPGTSQVPTWEMPFVPAGGNRFLFSTNTAASASQEVDPGDQDQASALALSLSLPRLAAGTALPQAGNHVGAGPSSGGAHSQTSSQLPSGSPAAGAVLLASLASDPSAAALLAGQLTDLAPRLASLVVLLRTEVLPAIPWLAAEATDRLQAEVAETGAAITSVAACLSEAVALLPGAPAAFGAAPLAAGGTGSELARRAAEVGGGRDAWLWAGLQDKGKEEEKEQGPLAPGGWASGTWAWHPLLRVDLPALCSALTPLLKDRKGGPKAVSELLGKQLGAQLAAASARASLLETELHFCCRAAALQAQHVSHLFLLVCGEIELAGKERGRLTYGAADGGGGAASSSGGLVLSGTSAAQATSAAAALASVLQSLDELGRRPSEQGLADLVSSLEAARPRLELGLRALASAGTNAGASSGSGPGVPQEPTERCLVDVRELTLRLGAIHGAFKAQAAALTARRLRARHATIRAVAPDLEVLPSGKSAATSMPWDFSDGGGGLQGGNDAVEQASRQRPTKADWQ